MSVDKKEIQEKMAEFRSKVKLLNLKIPDEIETILSLDRSYLSSAPRENLCVDSVRLSQYALYIKSESNRLKANISWCQANIDSIIGREINNTEGYGIKEKSLIIVRNDPVARELESIKSVCETQLNSIDDIDRKIEFMANTLKNLSFERRSV